MRRLLRRTGDFNWGAEAPYKYLLLLFITTKFQSTHQVKGKSLKRGHRCISVTTSRTTTGSGKLWRHVPTAKVYSFIGKTRARYQVFLWLSQACFPDAHVSKQARATVLTGTRSGPAGPGAQLSAPGCCSPPWPRCTYSSGRRLSPNSSQKWGSLRRTKLDIKHNRDQIQIVPGTPPFCIHF